MSLTTNEKKDKIYYDVTITNPHDANQEKALNFEETRDKNILDNQEDFQVALTKMYINSDSIPLFKFRKEKYKITMEKLKNDETFDKQEFKILNFDGKFIFRIDQFIRIINDALEELHQRLFKTDATKNLVPFIKYDPSTKLLSIFKILNNNVKQNIFFNHFLAFFFRGLNHEFLSLNGDKSIKFLFDNPANINKTSISGKIYVKSTENFSRIIYWRNILRIIIQTNINIRNNKIGNQENTGVVENEANILDIIPINNNLKFPIVVKDSSNREFVDIIGRGFLKQFSFQVLIEDFEKNKFPLFIQNGSTSIFEFLFIKKDNV